VDRQPAVQSTTEVSLQLCSGLQQISGQVRRFPVDSVLCMSPQLNEKCITANKLSTRYCERTHELLMTLLWLSSFVAALLCPLLCVQPPACIFCCSDDVCVGHCRFCINGPKDVAELLRQCVGVMPEIREPVRPTHRRSVSMARSILASEKLQALGLCTSPNTAPAQAGLADVSSSKSSLSGSSV
jgi:hypothetical protein